MNKIRRESPPLQGKVTPTFLIAALLPLLGYLASVGLAEAKRWGAPTLEVAIEGYDPRDFVRGHFLNYQIALGPSADGSLENAPLQGNRYSFSYACATHAPGGLSKVFLHHGNKPEGCDIALPLKFVQDDHRFFIQQDQARNIEQAVQARRATVLLRVLSNTEVTADKLLIDGKIVGSR